MAILTGLRTGIFKVLNYIGWFCYFYYFLSYYFLPLSSLLNFLYNFYYLMRFCYSKSAFICFAYSNLFCFCCLRKRSTSNIFSVFFISSFAFSICFCSLSIYFTMLFLPVSGASILFMLGLDFKEFDFLNWCILILKMNVTQFL